jgi:hypothetical protein
MRHASYGAAAALALLLVLAPGRFHQTVHAQTSIPIVFQAAGPTPASIQSMVEAFRTALGDNNGNVAGPLTTGRREINWDGGGSTATSVVPTPFDGFLVNRGGRFSTDGTGFVQAPVEGLADVFDNPGYTTFFQAFSPVRLFSTIESTRTTARFFVPGGGELRATTNAFGAVFSDVDRNDGVEVTYDANGRRRPRTTTSILFFGVRGNLLYSAAVPASRGDASLSFLGVKFPTARVARVQITTGNAAPGPRVGATLDVVMMDDFIYGEPQAIPATTAIDDSATP